MKAELKDPYNDKNFSVHIFCKKYEKEKVLITFHKLCKKEIARPFLQGDSPLNDYKYGEHWYMIEFWCHDADKIIQACEFLEQELEIKIQGL